MEHPLVVCPLLSVRIIIRKEYSKFFLILEYGKRMAKSSLVQLEILVSCSLSAWIISCVVTFEVRTQ